MYFTHSISIDIMSIYLNINEQTANKLVSCLLKLIETDISLNTTKLGGPGTIVQIDECCITKRKYQVGRVIPQTWVFGCIDSSNGDIALEICENRTKKTLGDLIEKYIMPGSEVHSDEFSSYKSYFMNNNNYIHKTVNHSQNFVDPITRANTQKIECLWGKFKRFKRKRCYSKRNLNKLYLSEFIARKRFISNGYPSLFGYLIKLVFF